MPEVSDIEKQVFRKILSNPKKLAENLNKVSPDDFTIRLAKIVIAALSDNGNATQYATNRNYFEIILRDSIKDKNELNSAAEMLAGISSSPADTGDLELLIKELKANRMCREMTKLIQGSIQHINPESIDETYEELMSGLLQLPLSSASGVSVATTHEIHDAIDERVMSYQDAASTKFPTGIKAFDKSIGGFAPGELVVITAGTGQGKSNVMLWWAEKYVERGAGVLYVTIEMSYQETMHRYGALATGYPTVDISNKRIPEGKLPDYYEKMMAHVKDKSVRKEFLAECETIVDRHDPKYALEIARKYKNREGRLFVVDIESANPSRIEREIQRISMDNKIDYVFVDFINVMDPQFHNRDKVKELASISRDLKKVARKTKTTLFSAAQLDTTSLSGDQNEKISADRVKYARAIGENSDWMIAFNRTEEDDRLKQIRLQLAKHRHSGDCVALIEFDFSNLQAIDLGSWKPEVSGGGVDVAEYPPAANGNGVLKGKDLNKVVDSWNSEATLAT